MNSASKSIAHKPSLLYMLLLCALALLAYFRLFHASFISWDDGDVLLNNKDVHRFDLKAFFTGYYVGNYAPLTMTGFAIDWLLFHGNAALHHGINILLHLLNAILVYRLSRLLFEDQAKALLCAVIFCFHPLQVETVAWVSAKNNILYGQFFLLGLTTYVRYVQQGERRHYLCTLLLFIASVLSKPSAICFPLCILLLDYALKPKPSLKTVVLNKIPFALIALALGLVTLYTRTEDKFITGSHAYAIHERIGYAGYALLQYIYKFLLPANLSVIYPYPENRGLAIALGYGMILALGVVCFRAYRSGKLWLWLGLLFFVSNLLLVLQFVPFGEVLTADRYMYLPVIGLAWALAALLPLREKQLVYLSLALTLVLGTLTFLRTAVWQTSINLYSDIIQKYPHSFVALNSLGAEHMLNKNYDQSLRYLNAAIHENVEYYKGYYNRGLLYAQTERMPEAVRDFSKAIDLKQYPKAYVARANAYYMLHDFEKAIADARRVLATEPQNVKALYVLATSYDELNQLDKALDYYNQAIYLSNDNPLYLMRRAILHGKRQDLQACVRDLDAAIALDARFGEAYYWRGVARANMKQDPCSDLKAATDLGFEPALPALKTYCR